VGRAVVREFGSAGWDVAVLGRGRAGLDAAVADVEASGRRAFGVVADVSDLDAVRRAADEVERQLGEIVIWVNVAFVGALRFFWDTDPEVYRRITDVTYFGQVNGTRVALERMRPRDRGSIVQVGSALAFRGIPLQSAYCGAKHAVKGFTESVISELRHEHSRIHVGMVELPGVNTPQFNWNDNGFDGHPMPVAPIFQPETAARAIRYVAEHRRRNMWVGVSTAYTILGNRLAPNFLDWYLGRFGVDGQISEAPGERRGSNVFKPRDDERDAGAHGIFDDKAHAGDPWSWLSIHRSGVVGAAIGLAITGAASARSRRSRRWGGA
jgi:NAD(P)-dependent dehydrogenase (short-subunit alcohol dehydrogenase family)